MTAAFIQRFASSFVRRIAPIISKLFGRSPSCPWSSCFSLLDPRVRWGRPPIQIKKISQTDDQVLLSFDNRLFWFPIDTIPSLDLWNEYLVAFWNSPSNFHYYFKSASKLNKGDVVVDCGACEGFFIANALEQGASKVYAIEPNPTMVRCLQKTFQHEILENRVVILPFVLGSSECDIHFNFDKKDPFSGKISQSGLVFRQTTLDILFDSVTFHNIDFIKMDLEGHEGHALLGGSRLIARFFPKLSIATYHAAEDFCRTFNIIKGFGYKKIASSGVTPRNDSQSFRPYLIHAG